MYGPNFPGETVRVLNEKEERQSREYRTGKVTWRTTVLLVRARYHLHNSTAEAKTPLLAEDCLMLAFPGGHAGQLCLFARARLSRL